MVLISLLTTHKTMKRTTTTNVSPSSSTSCALISSNFGVYQQTYIGSRDISICTLVSEAISTEPYRKALITKLFSRQIMIFPDNPCVYFSNSMSTATSYFRLITGSTERKENPLPSIFKVLHIFCNSV